ncbi:DNA-3-methyladenine glycosylase I [Streptomyces sp. SPB78]|uniref:DNA-3-methyladenine glycosylase I n=2 Tax=unclassified Streptomyces TaxID=2593676 RepID=UPI0001B53914|nr:DNA-3-methyladenine glycosylase I [Streptomyces sp. SPB78]EFL02468.1 DNA-3-methyladenine glycosylase I [Streptomyces sp. SPB78]
MTATGALPGPDGRLRCPWGLSAPDYLGYHDEEWGRPVLGDDALFERLSLEAFQSGLSWLTILRRRPAFRTAFDDFKLTAVAAYGPAERARLLADAGIIRNARKIDAVLANARLLAGWAPGELTTYLWSFAPAPDSRPARRTTADVPAVSRVHRARRRGSRSRASASSGSTTAYALMQSVRTRRPTHLVACAARGRGRADRPGREPGEGREG